MEMENMKLETVDVEMMDDEIVESGNKDLTDILATALVTAGGIAIGLAAPKVIDMGKKGINKVKSIWKNRKKTVITAEIVDDEQSNEKTAKETK